MNFILLLLISSIQLTETTTLSAYSLTVIQGLLAFILAVRLVSSKIFLNGNVRVSNFDLISFAVVLLLFLYPVLHLGFSYGVMQYGFLVLLPPLFLTIGAVISNDISAEDLWIFIFFGYFAFIIVVLTGGFDFPYLNFTDKDRNYSQGFSLFYGLQVIACMLLLGKQLSLTKKVVLMLSILVFFILSILGGGRGEILILTILCFLWLMIRSPIIAIPISVFLGSLILAILFQYQEELIFIARFERLLADENIRVSLWMDAYNLILNSPNCLLFGCGSGYFELMTNQERYPHNFFIEYLISAGIFPFIAFIFLIYLILHYVFMMRKFPSEQLFIPLSFFFIFGLAMKSTTFNTNFILWLLLFFSIRQIKTTKKAFL